MLEQAVTWQLIDRNPSDRIRNRQVKLDEDREIRPFADWAEVEAIAAELVPAYRALPLFLVGTGMRPEEALALEWKDIDKANAVASDRTCPLAGPDEAVQEVRPAAAPGSASGEGAGGARRHPRRIDSRLVFPGHDGDYLKQATFRLRHWTPALRAAGIEHRGVYACRHTFAAWSIAAGVQLFYLSRIMGTS